MSCRATRYSPARCLQESLILLSCANRHANAIRRAPRPQRTHCHALLQQASGEGGCVFSQIAE